MKKGGECHVQRMRTLDLWYRKWVEDSAKYYSLAWFFADKSTPKKLSWTDYVYDPINYDWVRYG